MIACVGWLPAASPPLIPQTNRGRFDEVVIQHDRGLDHDHVDHAGHGTQGVLEGLRHAHVRVPVTARHVGCRSEPALARANPT